jgi:hypothetical protein
MNRIAFVDVSVTSIGTALGILAALIGAGAWLLSQWRTGSAKAGQTAVANWKEMALSEEALRKRLEVEKAAMEAELQECTEFRDEFALHVVRAAAREKKYQECINELQEAMGKPKTKWDDPTSHVTQSPSSR